MAGAEVGSAVLLPELRPGLHGCGYRQEEAWPTSSQGELPHFTATTFSLGIRAPSKLELHFRGLKEDLTSLRTRRPRRQQPGNGRGEPLSDLEALAALGEARVAQSVEPGLVALSHPKAWFWKSNFGTPCEASFKRIPHARSWFMWLHPTHISQ